MKRLVSLFAALSLLAFGVTAVAQDGPSTATADIINTDGQSIGSATLTESASGVDVQVEVSNLETGLHGTHLHQTGVCEPPSFDSAGDHFNPTDQQHGLENPEGPHAGDLPNIDIGEDGSGTLSYVNDRISISTGDNAILDDDGTAIIIHQNEDDQETDPGGESGDRVACGEIVMADGAAPEDADAVRDVAPAAGEIDASGAAELGLMHTVVVGLGALALGAGLLLRASRNPT